MRPFNLHEFTKFYPAVNRRGEKVLFCKLDRCEEPHRQLVWSNLTTHVIQCGWADGRNCDLKEWDLVGMTEFDDKPSDQETYHIDDADVIAQNDTDRRQWVDYALWLQPGQRVLVVDGVKVAKKGSAQ